MVGQITLWSLPVLQDRPLRDVAPRHHVQGGIQITRLPCFASCFGFWMLAWPDLKDQARCFGPLALQQGEANTMAADRGSAEALHAVIVDETVGLERGQDVVNVGLRDSLDIPAANARNSGQCT